jgi:CRISPR-associated protein Cmr5
MKAVNKLLRDADTALKTTTIVNGGKVVDVFKGYIAGFGPSVISSGLVPALAFYLEDKDNKGKVIDAIAKTLNPESNGKKMFDESLLLEGKRAELNIQKEKIINASIALKIMLRTYEFYTPKK